MWWEWIQGTLFLMAGGQMLINDQRLKTRQEVERLWDLLLAADGLGCALLPRPFSLRLLPFAVPLILSWKRAQDIFARFQRESGGMRCC